MYKIWFWAMIERESDGRFVARIPDLGDLAAYGSNEKDAVANVTDLAAEHVRSLVESGQPVPRPRPASEVPTSSKPNKIGRAMVPVQVGRAVAAPTLLTPL